jgi:Flp pilus assembly protein TadG
MNGWQRAKRQLRDFNRDTSGIALLYVTVMLPVIVGLSLLAVDVGRIWNLQSSLQHGSDALALAGAGELDLRPDAIVRANRAIDNLILTNTSLFATTVVQVRGSAVDLCYLAALPASDATPINSPADCLDPGLATSPLDARFVQVTVNPVDFNTIFPASFLGASNSKKSSAQAVAGFKAAVCNFTPMFICNPYELSGNTNLTEATELYKHFDQVNYPDRIGRLINMKQTGGNGAQYFPGNFGFLVPEGASNNPGANVLRQYVGQVAPKACFVSDGVELRTGNIESIRFGFNTRFDMYDGPFNGEKGNANYRPARNVRKGMANDKTTGSGKGTPCNPDEDNGDADLDFSKLRRDTCFATNSCPNMGGRMGDGVWDKATYWARAHNGASLPGAISGTYVSRYDVYKYELANYATLVQDDSNGTGGSKLGGEIGRAACYNNITTPPSDTPDRRIFYSAILNCQALNSSVTYGPIQGGSGNKLPVLAFGRFFLTEPVGGDRGNQNSADGDVWAELVELETPGKADSVARDLVQLYR